MQFPHKIIEKLYFTQQRQTVIKMILRESGKPLVTLEAAGVFTFKATMQNTRLVDNNAMEFI